jgi:hypothetical protein
LLDARVACKNRWVRNQELGVLGCTQEPFKWVLWEKMAKDGYKVALRHCRVDSKAAAQKLEVQILEGAKFAGNSTDNGGQYDFDQITVPLRLTPVVPYNIVKEP